MRELNIGTKKYTKVEVMDEPGQGNANHEYLVIPVVPPQDNEEQRVLCRVSFQNGSIKEAGVNGIHNEDLLAIVLDRLIGFQSGRYNCSENSSAKVAIMEALCCLNDRTKRREDRGVKGTNAK